MRRFVRNLILFALFGAVLWGFSFAADWMRSKPVEPREFSWAPEFAIKYTDIGGVKVRYATGGYGPTLVLFHTLRTQIDVYHKMIPELMKSFRVYAFDYPGHGWSDIPDAKYHPDDFYEWVERTLDKLEVEDAAVVGISIGGTVALELAARYNPRIARVISINPYDYEITYGSGLKGSSLLASIMFTATDWPYIGELFMRLRNSYLERRIFEGGVIDPSAITDELFKQLSTVGNRQGHARAFLSLLRNQQSWQEARDHYSKIEVPVLLIYGDQDWAPQADRDRTKAAIPNAKLEIVRDGGHFLSLDQPKVLGELIKEFAGL